MNTAIALATITAISATLFHVASTFNPSILANLPW